MVLKAKARISGDAGGRRLRIYLPSSITLDSAFPFEKGEEVVLSIDQKKRRIVVEKRGG